MSEEEPGRQEGRKVGRAEGREGERCRESRTEGVDPETLRPVMGLGTDSVWEGVLGHRIRKRRGGELCPLIVIESKLSWV